MFNLPECYNYSLVKTYSSLILLFMLGEKLKIKRECVCINILLIKILYLFPPTQNKFQGFIFDLVTNQVFNVIIMVLICFQAITIMIQSDEQSLQMDIALYWINSVFVMLYAGECVLKLIVFHCNYFTSGWNIFDFMVVVFSITGKILLSQTQASFYSKYLLRYILLISKTGRIPFISNWNALHFCVHTSGHAWKI